ncbi:MAG: SIMPL domain-containing protein [Proteobacteria bacterium]|nr:SIMPL domain-containing protein [Pseudomonadota bacterium]
MVAAPLWLALALAGPAAGPVTVEIVAVGHVDAPATKFVLTIDLTTSGDSEDQAKAALAKKKAALLKQLSAAGATLTPDEAGKFPPVKFDALPSAAGESKTAEEKPVSSERFSVQASTRAAISAAQEIVSKTEGASADQAPVSSIGDNSSASRAAKRDAIARAKLDAQNYADALGYATATVVSVSERGDLGTLFTYGMSMAARGPKSLFEPSRGDTVPIDVAVTVTFRLDGKK